MSEGKTPEVYRDGMPVYPHFSRQWWYSLAYAIDHLADTYIGRNLYERVSRRILAHAADRCRSRARRAKRANEDA